MQYKCENNHVFEHAAKLTVLSKDGSLETPVCPHCRTATYFEYKKTDVITNVVSVDISEVDTKLKEGYVVESLYAKTATLVKRESQ